MSENGEGYNLRRGSKRGDKDSRENLGPQGATQARDVGDVPWELKNEYGEEINISGSVPTSSTSTSSNIAGKSINIKKEGMKIEIPHMNNEMKEVKVEIPDTRAIQRHHMSIKSLADLNGERIATRKQCKTDNCVKQQVLRGYCLKHAREKLGDEAVDEHNKKRKRQECKTDNCVKQSALRGYCLMCAREKLGDEVMNEFYEKEKPRKECKIDNCVKKQQVRGYCSKHAREKLGGEVVNEHNKKQKPHMKCKIDNCVKVQRVRGYCLMHAREKLGDEVVNEHNEKRTRKRKQRSSSSSSNSNGKRRGVGGQDDSENINDSDGEVVVLPPRKKTKVVVDLVQLSDSD